MVSINDIKNMPKYSVIRLLHEGSIPFEEVMWAYEISAVYANTGPEVYGLVYRSRSGWYYIVINESLSPTVQEEILFLELRHIIEDLPQTQYVIGVDMQHHKIEEAADVLYSVAVAAAKEK